jgi:hypothetical protein
VEQQSPLRPAPDPRPVLGGLAGSEAERELVRGLRAGDEPRAHVREALEEYLDGSA